MPSTIHILAAALAATISSSRAQSSSNIFGFGGDSSCSGASFQNYCCDGSIINPSGNFGNNGNNDLSSFICCLGDPFHGVTNSPGISCSVGSAVPLTEADGMTASMTVSASSAGAGVTMLASGSGMTMVMDGTTMKMGGAGGSATATPGASPSSSMGVTSATGGGVRHIATFVPVAGGLAIGVAGLL